MQLKPIALCRKCALRRAALLIIYKPSDLKGVVEISYFCRCIFWTLSEMSWLPVCLYVNTHRLLWNILLMFLRDACAVTYLVTQHLKKHRWSYPEIYGNKWTRSGHFLTTLLPLTFEISFLLFLLLCSQILCFCGTLADKIILLVIPYFCSSCNNHLDCFTQNKNRTIIYIVTWDKVSTCN